MRTLLKKISALVPVDFYQRLLAFSILRNEFRQIASTESFKEREALWDLAIGDLIGHEKKLVYVEFGVWQGRSIKYFAVRNINRESLFLGLDSFDGLPEDWGTTPKGAFSTDGRMPVVDDPRVRFIKGWFQDSWERASALMASARDGDLLVHYDADLYSSTLFALTKIDGLKKSYHAIFDEFTGQETRALYNYCQAYGATVAFLAKTNGAGGLPMQVLCRITPKPPAA